ncbi:MAG: hypothetical protein RRA92_05160 [Gemmatimonadota bacterium]|nr:hypothetical protein [Gemmatimonadota bacterium]
MSDSERLSGSLFLAVTAAVLVAAGCSPGEQADSSGEQAASPGPPAVRIAVDRVDRPVTVAGHRFGRGVHTPSDVDWAVPGPDRRGLAVRPAGWPADSADIVVSMDAAGLNEVHVDATVDPGTGGRELTLVYGVYRTLPPMSTEASVLPFAAAAAKSWDCVWCRGELLICGIDPRCR